MRQKAVLLIATVAAVVGALVATPIAVYASHQFGDVPNTNPFHNDIDWLADAEVTLGCGAGQYCPKDFVTREQMAAFMRRLAENRVVDAGTLEGLSADDLANGSVGAGSFHVLAGSVNSDATGTTGDVTDGDFDGIGYDLTFDGQDLDGCSGVVTAGYNTDTPAGSVAFVKGLIHVGHVSPGLGSDQARVQFYDLFDEPTATSFHVIVVCP